MKFGLTSSMTPVAEPRLHGFLELPRWSLILALPLLQLPDLPDLPLGKIPRFQSFVKEKSKWIYPRYLVLGIFSYIHLDFINGYRKKSGKQMEKKRPGHFYSSFVSDDCRVSPFYMVERKSFPVSSVSSVML